MKLQKDWTSKTSEKLTLTCLNVHTPFAKVVLLVLLWYLLILNVLNCQNKMFQVNSLALPVLSDKLQMFDDQFMPCSIPS